MKKSINIAVVTGLFIFSVGAGCVNYSQQNQDTTNKELTDMNSPYTIPLGETIELSGGLKIHFVDVTEDSRCPSKVNCAWIGRVVTQFTITQDDKILGNIELSGPPFGTPNSAAPYNDQIATMGDYSFILEAVKPYPETTQKIDPSKYTVTLRIETGEKYPGMTKSLQKYQYGTVVSYTENELIHFPDFDLTFVGMYDRTPENFPNQNVRLLYYDFVISKGTEKQTVSWSSGLGEIVPHPFEVEGQHYTLERTMIKSSTPGPTQRLAENELVITQIK